MTREVRDREQVRGSWVWRGAGPGRGRAQHLPCRTAVAVRVGTAAGRALVQLCARHTIGCCRPLRDVLPPGVLLHPDRPTTMQYAVTSNFHPFGRTCAVRCRVV